jgi:diadenosine tetraphosphate (Ap4A) HIT family hydrolase
MHACLTKITCLISKKWGFCGWVQDMRGFQESDDGKSRWLMQNKHFFALLDRYPKVTGHTLVVAKRHSRDITEVKKDEAKSLGRILRKVAKLLKESLGMHAHK